jgi:hypothetical protein
VADLQNTFGERLDMFNVSVREQLIPNREFTLTIKHANPVYCQIDGNCTDPLLPVAQTVVLGMNEGDLQLMTHNRSKDTPVYRWALDRLKQLA